MYGRYACFTIYAAKCDYPLHDGYILLTCLVLPRTIRGSICCLSRILILLIPSLLSYEGPINFYHTLRKVGYLSLRSTSRRSDLSRRAACLLLVASEDASVRFCLVDGAKAAALLYRRILACLRELNTM